MTPQGKKALIIISSFVIVGGVIGYVLYKRKKKKEADSSSADPALESSTVIDSTRTAPQGAASAPPDVKPAPNVKSASGYLVSQSMYFVKGLSSAGAYSYPDKKNAIGKITRVGDKAPAIFVADAGTAGWIKVKAMVTDFKGKVSPQLVYVMANLFTPKKP